MSAYRAIVAVAIAPQCNLNVRKILQILKRNEDEREKNSNKKRYVFAEHQVEMLKCFFRVLIVHIHKNAKGLK